MLYMVTFTVNLPPMLAYIPYMDPMGIYNIYIYILGRWYISPPNATEIRSSPRIAKCLQCVPEDTHTNLSEDKAGNGAYNI